MVQRILRVITGLALILAGALLHAASRQRWSGACGDWDSRACELRQDHLYDFLPPAEPWEQIGTTAQLGGTALLVMAGAFLLLTVTLAGRRIGPAIAAIASALTYVSMGRSILESANAGVAVDPVSPGLTHAGWLLGPLVLLVWLAIVARGWSRASAIVLTLASPYVAYISYATGPFDAAPWWESVMGFWVATAGLLLLVAAVRPARERPARDQAEVTSEPIAAM